MEFLVQLAPIILLFVIMWLLLIRPQKKREKATNEMRSNIKVGDEIVTIGGICGKVVKTKDETIVIQVGADKVKFEMMRWSVSRVVSSDAKASGRKDRAAEEEEAPKKVMPKRMKKAHAEEAAAEAVSDSAAEVAPAVAAEAAVAAETAEEVAAPEVSEVSEAAAEEKAE